MTLQRLLLLSGLAAAFTAAAAGLPATNSTFQPFVVEWPADTAHALVDVSFLQPAPAGKDGFVRIKDGHLVQPDGQRFRMWGFSATSPSDLPTKESAPAVAAHLVRLGVNCIRFHQFDKPAPMGLIDATRNDTRALDPKQMDRLDFFIAELKKHGIYSDLNLNVSRTYKPGDGVRDAELIKSPSKSLTFFDERMLELQREYARQLLTHVNAYTHQAYCDEPAVAAVEIVNENSLFLPWMSNNLIGAPSTKPGGNSGLDIPPSYGEALTKKFNTWLKNHFKPETLAQWRTAAGLASEAPLPRLRREQFEQAPHDRFHAEATFYLEIEHDYFRDMAKFLREDVGVKSLIMGDSDFNHWHTGYPQTASRAQLDIVDAHAYWQHPNYRPASKGAQKTGFDIKNTPMVDDPLHSTVIWLSRTAVAGKPFTVTEANQPFPNEYACEAIPILAAYAALQDWDGVFWYTLGHIDVVKMEHNVNGHFDFSKDPVKMSQIAAAALLFRRGDVRPAQRTVDRSYTREQVIESLRLPAAEDPYFTPGFPLALPLQHAVRVTSFDGPATGKFEPVTASPIVSDTGELVWRGGAKGTGLVTIDTPRSQALIGWLGRTGAGAKTQNLSVDARTPFCALTLSALDDKPIASARRLLLTATARTANTGMEWNAKRTSVDTWGGAPTRIEVVTGTVLLTGLEGAPQVTAQPLDGGSRPLGKAVPLTRTAAGWTLDLGNPTTTWYGIEVSRP